MSAFGLHHLLLSDRPRLDAARRALARVVRPGDVVVDLGAGTGILGLLALRAGAARVYAVERHPILGLARRLARENGVEDRVRFVRGDALRVRLPERADLVVSDFVGPLGIDEEMARVVAGARRFLKPGGRFLPERSEVWIAPVSAPGLHRRHVRAGEGHGVRLEAVHAIAANQPGSFAASPRGLAAPLRRAWTFDFARDRAVFPKRARLSFSVKGGLVHGLAVVVRVALAPGVRMESTYGCHWRPVFLPLREPLRTSKDRRLDVELALHDPWNAEWRVGERRQSTLLERTAYER